VDLATGSELEQTDDGYTVLIDLQLQYFNSDKDLCVGFEVSYRAKQS